jgi:hypothetical protein
MSNRYVELTSMLRSLKLPTMADHVTDVAVKAVRNGLSHEAFLHELARLECEVREQRRSARYLSESGLPREKTLRTLRLEVFPALIRQQIERLRSGASCNRRSTWWQSGNQALAKAIFWPALAMSW